METKLSVDAPMSAPSLEPCPFCGGEAEMDTLQGYRALGSGHVGTRLTIYCTKCTAEVGHCREDVPGIEPEHVIEEWNRRSRTLRAGQSEPVAIDVEKIMAMVDDYTDHFVEVASQRVPFVADVVVLKAKKSALRAALASIPTDGIKGGD